MKFFAINVKIMLTENINIDKGMVNGALVVMVNIGFDIHHKVDAITIMLKPLWTVIKSEKMHY